MMDPSLTTLCIRILLLVSAEVLVMALILAVILPRLKTAMARRTFCQVALTSVLIIMACEFSGTGSMIAGWVRSSLSGAHSQTLFRNSVQAASAPIEQTANVDVSIPATQSVPAAPETKPKIEILA